MKNKFTLLFLIFGMLTLFFACQKEDNLDANVESQIEIQKELQVTMTNWRHLSEENKKASLRVSEFQNKNRLARNTKSEIYDFIIDTSRVQIIQQEGFTTYAFYVMRPVLNSNIIENYLYKEYDNGEYSQYLLSYNSSIDNEGTITHDAQSLQIMPIDDSSLLYRVGCVAELTNSFNQTVCEIRFHCTGESNHEIGDECPCGTSLMSCLPGG